MLCKKLNPLGIVLYLRQFYTICMAIRTATEIQARLDELDARISDAEDAMSFSLDTGQGRQSVNRQSLDQMYRAREYWEGKLRNLEPGGLTSVEYRRRG